MQTSIQQRRLRPYSSLALVMCLSMGACTWIPKGDAQLDVGIKDRGVASWYGDQFHGKQAANGEIFDKDALTAAHRTMPLGSVVRVVNVTNGKHLFVRITDRGPYERGRILDLSHGAAVQLGMEQGGVARVQIEMVGERHPELIVFSEKTIGKVATLLAETASAPIRTAQGMASPLRNLPSDVWVTMRSRRAPSTLDGDHGIQPEVPTLVLS